MAWKQRKNGLETRLLHHLNKAPSEKDKNPLWGRRVTGKKTDDTRGVPNIIRYIMGIR